MAFPSLKALKSGNALLLKGGKEAGDFPGRCGTQRCWENQNWFVRYENNGNLVMICLILSICVFRRAEAYNMNLSILGKNHRFTFLVYLGSIKGFNPKIVQKQ